MIWESVIVFWKTNKKVEAASHFVRDYQLYVRKLFSNQPADKAAALAVGGGNFEAVGSMMLAVLLEAGLRKDSSIIDFGCGGGRLAQPLAHYSSSLNYLGTDVASELLEYAAANAPDNFSFRQHTELNFPAADESVDFIVAFSVLTHLLHEESYTYLLDAKRVLKSGGRFVFSFLESEKHWGIFQAMLTRRWLTQKPHLNMFIERSTIEIWAKHSGLAIVGYDIGPDIGQSVVVLEKN